jgi:hypothetical protein
MKKLRLSFLLLAGLLPAALNSQVSFTINSVLCTGNSITLTANTGTLSAIAYSWAALPSGPVFSSSSSATTGVTFTSPGTFTVALGVLSGSGYAYTTNTITINPSPTLIVNPPASTLCPGKSATITAGGATTFFWAPPNGLNTSSGATVIASPSATTIYTITGIGGGCVGSASLNVSVGSYPNNWSGIITTSSVVCAGFSASLTAFAANSYTWTGTNIPSPVFQQSISVGVGSYTVKGSGTLGCYDSSSIVIGLSPPLAIFVTQSSYTTCITNNNPKFSKVVHLAASGAGMYVWASTNPNFINYTGPTVDVRPSTSNCYTVVGNTAICSGSAVVCLTVIPQFSAGVMPSSGLICLGASLKLKVVNIGFNAIGPPSLFSYFWSEASNAPPVSISSYFSPTVSVFPQNNTTYTLEIKDAQNCISIPYLVTVSVAACTGITGEKQGEQECTLYPNPTSDKLNIRSDLFTEAEIEITDALGKVVLKQIKRFDEKGLCTITISNIPGGIYFVKVNSVGNETRVIRLVKE